MYGRQSYRRDDAYSCITTAHVSVMRFYGLQRTLLIASRFGTTGRAITQDHAAGWNSLGLTRSVVEAVQSTVGPHPTRLTNSSSLSLRPRDSVRSPLTHQDSRGGHPVHSGPKPAGGGDNGRGPDPNPDPILDGSYATHHVLDRREEARRSPTWCRHCSAATQRQMRTRPFRLHYTL